MTIVAYILIGIVMLFIATLMARREILTHLEEKKAREHWQTAQRLLSEDIENRRNSLHPPTVGDKPLFK